MDSTTKKALFEAIKTDDVTALKRALTELGPTCHTQLQYTRADGKAGSFIGFSANTKAWACFEYLLSLPVVKSTNERDVYESHTIWLFHTSNNDALTRAFRLNNDALSLKSFLFYLINPEHFPGPLGNTIKTLSSLGYPPRRWPESQRLKKILHEKHAAQQDKLIEACIRHDLADEAITLITHVGVLSERVLFLFLVNHWMNDKRSDFMQALHDSLNTKRFALAPPTYEILSKCYNTAPYSSGIGAFYKHVLPTTLQTQYAALFVDFACGSPDRFSLLNTLYEMAPPEVFFQALLRASRGVYRLDTMLDCDMDVELKGMLTEALGIMLARTLKKTDSFFLQREHIETTINRSLTVSQRRAMLRLYSHYFDYTDFVPYLTEQCDIDLLLLLDARPTELLIYAEDEAIKHYLVKQLAQ